VELAHNGTSPALPAAWPPGAGIPSFLGAAVCFWWALIDGRRGLQGYGVAVLAVFTTALHSSMLGVLLTVATTPWYPAYAPTTAMWGLTPLEDQHLGGVIMWVLAGVFYLLAALAFCAGWLGEAERQYANRQSRV
jgi:putative membrane protein